MPKGIAKDARSLGLLLQQGRLAAGLTQRQLALELGMTQSYLWDLENGKDIKALERVFAIIRRTGITMTMDIPND
jgi:HTH-type transcriptional regulator/antitoxin HipB